MKPEEKIIFCKELLTTAGLAYAADAVKKTDSGLVWKLVCYTVLYGKAWKSINKILKMFDESHERECNV